MIPATHARYILDASVAAKWFTRHEEPDREKALALRDRHRRRHCRLALPEFGLIEVMKSFIEVKSELGGKIVAFLIENEDPVMAGQPIIAIES